MESTSAGDSYTVRAVVYVEEQQVGEDWITATGYRATIRCEGETVAGAVVHPLATPAEHWPVRRGTFVWQAVEAFIAALPSLRVRSSVEERKSA